MRVFLTTSGLGTRLENLTQFTNKSLVKVGDKYAICHIIDQFDETTEFVITLGYYGDQVRDFLELAYPSRRFQFVSVDPYEGPGSSQAYSMLAAEHLLQTPFLYHCCDTLLPPNTFKHSPDLKENLLFVSPHSDYISYSGITVENGSITRFNKKREAIHDYVYIGVAYIQDPSMFWTTLRSAVVADPTNSTLGDTTAYSALIESFSYRVLSEFYDTGNLESYRQACKTFPGRHTVLEKAHESLCFLGHTVIKFINNPETNRRRVERAANLAPHVPQILGVKPNFLMMKYVQGQVLADSKEFGILTRLLAWAEAALWSTRKTDPAFHETCMQFYKTKTYQRIAEYRQAHSYDPTVINGVSVGSIDTLLARVPYESLATTTLTKYHGDFILDNILVKEGQFVLLDWREMFGDQVVWGDMYYDLAKLRHNIQFTHGNIAAGLFEIHKDADGIEIDMKTNWSLMRQLEEVDRHIVERGWNLQKVKILTALIWLNMAPLYPSPLADFLYGFGKLNLHLALHTPVGIL